MMSRALTPKERAVLVRQSYARMRERMLRVRRLLQTGGVRPAMAAQPNTGGMAPEAPPITMFCGVSGLRITV